jgi:uncharacterized protein (TIGR03067 family)
VGVLIAALAAGVVAGQTEKDSAGKEPASLEGVWSVVSMRDAGRQLPDQVKSLRFAFSGDTLIMRMPGRVIAETKYTTDTAKTPPTIDLTYEGKPTLGIYRIEDNQLTLSLSRSATERPTGFVSQADPPNQVIVLKRGEASLIGNPLYVANLDGSDLRKVAPLEQAMQDLSTGSPDWSPDGSKIAFDGWRLSRGETYVEAHVYVVGVDGTGLKDISVGAMPSWSPDGKRLTFCQYSPNRGVWVMDADGSNQKLIDAEGWGSDWSPAGNEIMYSVYGDGAEICIVDPDNGKRRTILGKQRYRSIYWNPSWSSDGKSVCFLGARENGSLEIATVSAEGSEKGFQVVLNFGDNSQYKDPIRAVSWDGRAERIITAMRGPDYKNLLLYLLDPLGKEGPQRVSGFDPNYNYVAAAWAPDGKRIALVRRDP